VEPEGDCREESRWWKPPGLILPADMDDETFVQLFGLGSTKYRPGREMEAIRAANLLMNQDEGGGAWIRFNQDPDAAPRGGRAGGRRRRGGVKDGARFG
jgi:5-methyltetrahydrofolate--homocysteine methyltransferase